MNACHAIPGGATLVRRPQSQRVCSVGPTRVDGDEYKVALQPTQLARAVARALVCRTVLATESFGSKADDRSMRGLHAGMLVFICYS